MHLIKEDSYIATSNRVIYSVAVPEMNLSKLEHAAQRLSRCVGECRPSYPYGS